MEPIKSIKRAPRILGGTVARAGAGHGDWAGRHRRVIRVVAVIAGVVGVLMNLIHEGGHRNLISMVIGTGFLLLAVVAWQAPQRVPRPPKYPEPFDKRG
ncbi:MAG: hypothetical protein ACRCYU_08610 [Nocardioides sp.]